MRKTPGRGTFMWGARRRFRALRALYKCHGLPVAIPIHDADTALRRRAHCDVNHQSCKKGTTVQTELLKVSGMTCGGCAGSVSRALKAVAGVREVDVSVSAGEATVHFDEHQTSREELQSAVIGAGYGVGAATAEQKHKSKGGCCG